MSTVEAAASLFGSDDPASDPFASVGNNIEQSTQGVSTDIPFGVDTLDSSNASFFDTPTSSHEASTYSNPNHETSQHNSYGWENQQNGWHHNASAGHTAANSYAPQPTHSPASSYSAPTQPTPQNPYAPPSTRDSAMKYAPPHASQSPYAPAQPSYQSQYSPAPMTYAPPAHTTPAPPQHTYGQPDYAAYSPASSAFAASSSPYAANSRSSSLPLSPPPPQPAPAPLTRPKVSNAYDPPLPPSKPAKRAPKSSLVTPFANDPYALYSNPAMPPSTPQHQQQFVQSPPPSRQNHASPPPNAYAPKQGEYVSAYSHEYAATALPPAQPPAQPPVRAPVQPPVQLPAQPPVEDLPPISTPASYYQTGKPAQPPPPPFRRPSSRQVSEHFGTPSRPSSRAISRTGSPLVNHVYNASYPDDVSKQEQAVPLPIPLTTEDAHSELNHDADIDPEGGEFSGSDWPADADKTVLGGEESQDLPSTQTASPPPRQSPVVTNTVPSTIHRASALYDPYTPRVASPPSSIPPEATNTSEEKLSPPLRSMSAAPDAYSPNPARISSPPVRSASAIPSGYASVSLSNGPYAPPANMSFQDPYSPAVHPKPPKPDESRSRSSSNGSALSISQARDPYAPSQHVRRDTSESGEYGSYVSSYSLSQPSGYTSDSSLGQDLAVPPAVRAPYAPSPSLLGTNDPLGRTNARAPVFTFGFGGKVVACFHGASLLNTGFDVALSSRKSTAVQIRGIKDFIPETALDISTVPFPGPLFSDPGSPTSLVRAGLSSQSKTRKAKVIKYLEERSEELERGAAYLHPGTIEKARAEGKAMITKLLKVMVENDGRLNGTPTIDLAVRNVILGQASTGASDKAEGVFTTAVELSGHSFGPYDSSNSSNETPLAITTLQKSMLEKIQQFLTQGERRQAYHYALDHKLWAHALVIASSIDKDSWNEAATEFIRAELIGGTAESDTSITGWEGLRAAYSAFAGQGAAAVGQLIPQSRLAQSTATLMAPLPSVPTPATPHFSSAVPLAKIPEQTLSQWSQTLAMLYTSPLTPELSGTLTALGDQLAHNSLIEAAHVCYLLSPQTSLIGGTGNPAAKIILLGGQGPQIGPDLQSDPDPIIFTEILEFAMSLPAPVKGQEAFGGFPHLQAFRLARASALAERGEIKAAQRYCDAIRACTTKQSPYLGPEFFGQLKALNDRIIAAPQVDKGSWIQGKMSKPSFDTLGTWFESSMAKIITGDGEPAAGGLETAKDEHTFDGPFSQLGTISSATPSTTTSPQASSLNLSVVPPPPGPTLVTNPYAPINRSTSAMDYTRRRDFSSPQVASAGPFSTSFPRASSFGQTANNIQSQHSGSPYGIARSSSEDSQELLTPKPSDTNVGDESTVQEVTWWGSSAYGEVPNSETPTAATFHKIEGNMTINNDGFISLMNDTGPFSATPSPPIRANSMNVPAEEEDEDLGLGNSKRPKKEQDEDHAHEQKASTPPKEDAAANRPAAQPNPTSSGSWFGRFFSRSTSGGPVKANLGEEKTFYYDENLKRWVNKKAGAEEPKPTPAPPPPRAQTASPSSMMGQSSSPNPVPGTPPIRAASVLNGSGPPPNKTIPRIRSNLVPIESTSAPPTPAPGAGLVPPKTPVDRPRSQASKRNVRSRYVDVFAEGSGGA